MPSVRVNKALKLQRRLSQNHIFGNQLPKDVDSFQTVGGGKRGFMHHYERGNHERLGYGERLEVFWR